MAHPIASVRERITKSKHPMGGEVTTGKETVRTANCPKHHRATSDYLGLNGNGWIFYCPGVKRPKAGEAPSPGHQFIADPPA